MCLPVHSQYTINASSDIGIIITKVVNCPKSHSLKVTHPGLTCKFSDSIPVIYFLWLGPAKPQENISTGLLLNQTSSSKCRQESGIPKSLLCNRSLFLDIHQNCLGVFRNPDAQTIPQTNDRVTGGGAQVLVFFRVLYYAARADDH